ncbi:MAG TPA: hypothetical protein VIJ20_00120 [Solirubrobacteraceae bacterium]
MTEEPFEGEEGEELVDGLPVLAEVRPIERTAVVGALPAVQAAAAAFTGFVAGAATLAVVRRRQTRRLARRQPGRALDLVPLTGTRTYLVHVHRVGRPEE